MLQDTFSAERIVLDLLITYSLRKYVRSHKVWLSQLGLVNPLEGFTPLTVQPHRAGRKAP